jgi:3-deoxy-7-phosphoheptulonate synthase
MESHLPVIVDPSQGCGRADLVRVLCQGAVAVGVDGLLIEVHPHPAEALSDGAQQLDFDGFKKMAADLQPLLAAMGRTV